MKQRILAMLLCTSLLMPTAAFVCSETAAAISADALGDVDMDGAVTLADASLTLHAYACDAAWLDSGLSSEQRDRADTTRDGLILIDDATGILAYYAKSAAGLNPTWGIEEPETPDVTVSLYDLNSPHAMLIDAQTGDVIAEKNGYSTIYPASMTKIMAAIVTIENFPNLNQYVTVPSAAIESAWSQGGSTAGFSAGDYVPMIDIIYGMLLPSGCECTAAAGIIICGSESAFVDLMNEKAAEIGMTGTHYANSSGLPNSNHYTTAYDMTLLLRYALQNDTFRMIDTSSNYTTSNGLYFSSTLFRPLINTYGTTAVTGGNILGGKTGSTSAAGICLTSFAEIYGREYILCTAKAPSSGQHIQDARTVYNRLGAALS